MTAKIIKLQKTLAQLLRQHLTEDDDPLFWDLTIKVLRAELSDRLFLSKYKGTIFLQLGACSHWLRPHQTRWTDAGGFALPTGYLGGSGFSVRGLPEFDWFIVLLWDRQKWDFIVKEKFRGKRKLTLRVALPTRTAKHNQAAVHTIWFPGDPINPNIKLGRIYGFRKLDGKWEYKVARDFQPRSAPT